MSTFPGTPKILKGGIVVLDPQTSAVLRIIPLQYNPDTLSRSFQIKGVGTEGGDRIEALRLKGPPVEPGADRETHHPQRAERQDQAAAASRSELAHAGARQGPHLAAAATAGTDVTAGRLAATWRITHRPWAVGIADRDRIAGIAAAVDVLNRDRASVGGHRRHSTIA